MSKDIICVACGSKNIVPNMNGGWTCLDCNFKWTEEIHEAQPDVTPSIYPDEEPDEEPEYPDVDNDDTMTEDEDDMWFGEK